MRMPKGENTTDGRTWQILRGCAALLFLVGLVRTAWVAEDAFITFRTVENFFAGHGLRWNVAERVQTYSHPLWMLLLCVGHGLTGETYFASLALGAMCTLVTLYWVGFRLGLSVAGAACVGFSLALTTSFVDYSTSGLEAPLTHLLLALLAGVLFAEREAGTRVGRLCLLAALAACNRPDTLLFFLPAILWEVRGAGLRGSLRPAFLGFLPLMVWGAFATFYYGSPLPITAYAKAMTGIPQGELWVQGWHFFQDALTRDPVLLPVLCLGLLTAWFSRRSADGVLAWGVLLYSVYLLKIGGGYMAGRFLTPPLLVGAILVGRGLSRVRNVWMAPAYLLVVFLLAVQAQTPSALSPSSYNARDLSGENPEIVDERGQWYPRTGLFAPGRDIPTFGGVEAILGERLDPEHPRIFVDGRVGLDGVLAGPGMHLVDPLLCDPLMMRLPVWDLDDWRIGHFMRRVPDGYLESLALGGNRVVHPGLARAYGDLRLAIRGDLWDPARAKAIWSLHFGGGQRGLRQYVNEAYRHPETVVRPKASLAQSVEEGASVWNEDFQIVGSGGVRIELPQPSTSETLRLGLGGLAEYRVTFFRGAQSLAVQTVFAGERAKLFPGIVPVDMVLPGPLAAGGWDALEVRPLSNRRSGIHCVAYLEKD